MATTNIISEICILKDRANYHALIVCRALILDRKLSWIVDSVYICAISLSHSRRVVHSCTSHKIDKTNPGKPKISYNIRALKKKWESVE